MSKRRGRSRGPPVSRGEGNDSPTSEDEGGEDANAAAIKQLQERLAAAEKAAAERMSAQQQAFESMLAKQAQLLTATMTKTIQSTIEISAKEDAERRAKQRALEKSVRAALHTDAPELLEGMSRGQIDARVAAAARAAADSDRAEAESAAGSAAGLGVTPVPAPAPSGTLLQSVGAKTAASDAFAALPLRERLRLRDVVCQAAAYFENGLSDARVVAEVVRQCGSSEQLVRAAIDSLTKRARQYAGVPFDEQPVERQQRIRGWVLAVSSQFERGLKHPGLAVSVSRRYQVSEADAVQALAQLGVAVHERPPPGSDGLSSLADAAERVRRQKAASEAAKRAALSSMQAQERDDNAALIDVLLASGRRDAALRLLKQDAAQSRRANAPRAYAMVQPDIVVRQRAAGSTRIANTGTAESALELPSEEGVYILDSLDTHLRPDRHVRAKQEERTREAIEFGEAGLLTVARREEFDRAADALREMKLPRKKLLKAAGGRPDGREALETVMFALRCAPAEVISAGRDAPSRESLELLLAELGLVGGSPLPSGIIVKNWHIATWVVRFITGGTDAVSSANTDGQRLSSHQLNASEERHRRFVYDAFDPRSYPLVGARPPTGGENIAWHLYCIERREEELALCRILFAKLRLIKSRASGKAESKQAIVRRYLFAHWVVRLVTGIYHEKPAPIFLASPDSPLVELCRDGELGKLFDKVLSGKKISPDSKKG